MMLVPLAVAYSIQSQDRRQPQASPIDTPSPAAKAALSKVRQVVDVGRYRLLSLKGEQYPASKSSYYSNLSAARVCSVRSAVR
jgi:hypothetical protein